MNEEEKIATSQAIADGPSTEEKLQAVAIAVTIIDQSEEVVRSAIAVGHTDEVATAALLIVTRSFVHAATALGLKIEEAQDG